MHCTGSVLFFSVQRRSASPAETIQHMVVTPTMPPVRQPTMNPSILLTSPVFFDSHMQYARICSFYAAAQILLSISANQMRLRTEYNKNLMRTVTFSAKRRSYITENASQKATCGFYSRIRTADTSLFIKLPNIHFLHYIICCIFRKNMI